MKKTLPPDEFDLNTASKLVLKACPFCGNYPITACSYNGAGMIGSRELAKKFCQIRCRTISLDTVQFKTPI